MVRYINPDVMQEVAETDYAMIVRGQISNALLITPRRWACSQNGT